MMNTKVTVRLRKAEDKKEWYVYLETYPVIVEGKVKPQRIRDYINRTVTTVVFDKKRPARTTSFGVTYKPKRDDNGILVCTSDRDKEVMLYADSLRKLKQREYDTKYLYTDKEAEQANLIEKSQQNFIEYFNLVSKRRHQYSSKSIRINWERTIEFLKIFAGKELLFSQVTLKFCEDFKLFLLNAPRGGNKKGTLAHNTAATYFSIFKALLKQAFIDGYYSTDIASKIKGITEIETRREYLTLEELDVLAETPIANEKIKAAALFSALTGLRHSDIIKLKWHEIKIENGLPRIHFNQKKTKGVEYMPISEQALRLCGSRGKDEDFVFEGLPDAQYISRPLKNWIKSSGITKQLSFHNFRHTYATLQISKGIDIYTVSKMLGHSSITTTQIYAKIQDEKKNEAANAIELKSLK